MASTKTQVDTLPDSKRPSRRRHDADLKSRVVAACDEPGASVAQIAMAHGLNANLVHKWRRGEKPAAARVPAAFIELPLQSVSQSGTEQDIRIEVRRGATTIAISWPASCGAECAAWLRDLLK
jgi:transposase